MNEPLTESQLLKILNTFDIRMRYQDAVIETLVNVIIDNELTDQEDFNERAHETYDKLIDDRQAEIDEIEIEQKKSNQPTYYGPPGEA
jgi:hypothetical protein